MNDAAVPPLVHDPGRLRALVSYGILDTVPEPGFDDIVVLARNLCAAPVALVSLVDRDRQWFKARSGFPRCETDLNSSVCAHVLVEPDLLIIPDLTADPRTAGNPLVTDDPHLRFYAGAPLRTPDGHVLGSLCVIDHAPRPGGLTAVQAESLRALARQVMTQLGLRRAAIERDAYAETQRAVGDAGGDLDAILGALVTGAMRAVPAAEGGAIELIDDADLEYRAVRGALAGRRGLRVPLTGSASGACATSGQSILVADAATDPRVKRDTAQVLGQRASIHVPVWRAGRVLGVLKLQSGRVGAFAEQDVRLAELFAGIAAAGLTAADEAEAQRALAAGEQRQRAILDSATQFAIVVTDRDGRITDWNTGAERTLGWSAEEMLGHTVERIFTPEDRIIGQAALEMRQALERGRAVDERWHLRKGDGTFWASGEMMPLRDAVGTHRGFVKILRDRTEEHLAGQALKEAEAGLRRAQEAGGVGLFAVDIPGDTLHSTPEFCRLYGLPERDSHPVSAVEALIIPEDAHLVSSAASRARGDAPPDVEYRIHRADTGELRWIARRGVIERDGTGRPVRFSGASRDVTERRSAQEASRATEERYRLATRATNDAIWDWDLTTNHILWNEALTAAYGHAPETIEPTGDWWIAHIHPEDRSRIDRSLHAVIDGADTTWTDEYRFLRADGSYAKVFDRGQVIRDAEGRAVRMIGAMLDLTRLRTAETALRVSQDRFQTLLETVETAFAIVEVKFDADDRPVDYRFLEANPAFERQAGVNLRGKWVTEFAPDLERFWFETYGRVAWTGEPAKFENYAEAFGRWFDVRAVRVGEPAERQIAILFDDVTARHERQARNAATQELSDRLRDLTEPRDIAATAAEIVGRTLRVSLVGYGRVDAEAETVTVDRDWSVAGVEELPDLIRPREYGSYFDDLLRGETVVVGDAALDPRTEAFTARLDAIGARAFVNLPVLEQGRLVALLYVGQERARPWTGEEVAFLRDVTELMRQTIERRRAEEHQLLLNYELSHRLKNTLAMVQAIAAQTLRRVTEQDAVEEFGKRMRALAAAHDVLLQQSWASARVRAVVEAVLGNLGQVERVDLDGPDMALGPRATLSLSLLLHELATNAMKYGALANEAGRVGVGWRVERDGDEPTFVLDWRERGGPLVRAPERRGFGSRLIRTGLGGAGGVELRYPQTGVEAEMRAPLSELQVA